MEQTEQTEQTPKTESLLTSNRLRSLLELGQQRGVTFDVYPVGKDLLVRERYTRRHTVSRIQVFNDMVRALTHAADIYCTHLHVVTLAPDSWRPHGFRINLLAATSDSIDLMNYCQKYSRLLTRPHHGKGTNT